MCESRLGSLGGIPLPCGLRTQSTFFSQNTFFTQEMDDVQALAASEPPDLGSDVAEAADGEEEAAAAAALPLSFCFPFFQNDVNDGRGALTCSIMH